jgi:hypothetical protein
MDYKKIKTYQQAFEEVLGIKFDEKLQTCVKYLEKEGYAERNIAYVVWKFQDKLSIYIGDTRFYTILQNEVRKNAKNQDYWNAYWKNKECIKKELNN